MKKLSVKIPPQASLPLIDPKVREEMGHVEATVELITPEMAKEWLERNLQNRHIRWPTVERYAAEIRAGKWQINGETFKFSRKGKLLDGQHRLQAILESGIPISAVVVRGLPEYVFETIDYGLRRQTGDCLHALGIRNAFYVASACSFIYHHRLGNLLGAVRKMSSPAAEVAKIAQEGTKLQDILEVLMYVPNRTLYPVSTAAGLQYLFSDKNEDLAGKFWKRFYHGNDLREDDPVLVFRNTMIRYRSNAYHGARLTRAAQVIYAITAWNALRQKRTLKEKDFADLNVKKIGQIEIL